MVPTILKFLRTVVLLKHIVIGNNNYMLGINNQMFINLLMTNHHTQLVKEIT